MVGAHFACLGWGLERIALASVLCGNTETQRASQDQEIQVTQWFDCSLWAKYEEQIQDMEDQVIGMREALLRAEGLIEDLKVDR